MGFFACAFLLSFKAAVLQKPYAETWVAFFMSYSVHTLTTTTKLFGI